MHPDPRFRNDGADPLELAAGIGLAHIVVATVDGPIVAHAPVTRHDDRLRFHLARANRLTPHLDGAAVLLSLVGDHGYISPNWYRDGRDQVPTWNYRAIEIEGVAARIDRPALVAQLDALADRHEPRPGPWHRDKMDADRFDRMLAGIVGFEVRVGGCRITDKFSQNKTPADRRRIAAALVERGQPGLARRIDDTEQRA